MTATCSSGWTNSSTGADSANRSQAGEAALADKLERLARTRLARESAKLDPREEKRLADEGLAEDSRRGPNTERRRSLG